MKVNIISRGQVVKVVFMYGLFPYRVCHCDQKSNPIPFTQIPPKSKPLIEAKSDGNLLVTWRQNFSIYGYTDADIFAQLVSTQGSGKSFGFPVQPSFPIVTSFADENYPAIGAFPGGNFVAVWSISLKSNDPQDCVNFENEYCKSGLYARFFAADETPVKNWYCLNNCNLANRVNGVACRYVW